MEDNEMLLTLNYEDGTQGKRKILTIFQADNKREYAALLVLDDEGNIPAEELIELVSIRPYLNENREQDYIIEEISSDMELQIAMESYARLSEPAAGAGEDENGLVTLSFKNGKGQYEDWSVVDVFENKGRKYIALIPLREQEGLDNEIINIHLMRLGLTVQGGIEGCEVFSIPSDMEYEEVARIFEKRVNEANTIQQ